ncbi:helix-turn-helix transcriptional regulator [Agromyces sp. CFH 90414]|uniref:Helix-turn-helix transcriptional regulator n=2 Tax=Agromyces agglutinans TaxID=2662258 RepID=A0A6I2F7G0_9MICO|nr:helix-turn-helix transcriptional regulator [Agromyces agglutinans]
MLGAVRADLERTLRAMAPRSRIAVERAFAGLDERLGAARAAQLIGAGGALAIPDAAREAATWLDMHAAAPEAGQADPDPLTPREADVLAVLAEGLTNKEIAAQLGLSVKTVMHHSVAIYRKLDVRGRAEATAVAHRRGLVPGTAAR